MILKYINQYLSIKRFAQLELTDFCVITGLNGSGKSQLLQSIKYEHIKIDDIPAKSIVLFDNRTFSLDGEEAISWELLKSEQKEAINLIDRSRQNGYSFFANAPHLVTPFIELAKKSDKPFYKLNEEDFNDLEDRGLVNDYISHVQSIRYYFENMVNQGTSASVLSIILRLLETSRVPIDKIYTIEDLENHYRPIVYKGEFLINRIGKIFFDYWLKWENNEYTKYRNKIDGEKNLILDEDAFIRKYGDKPWEILNRILEGLGNVGYRVNDPVGLRRDAQFTLKTS